jgi:FixJ family two-component response regulator
MVAATDAELLRGVQVIIVEDSYPVAESLSWLLAGAGCVVVGKAGNVAAGLALARGSDYDVAILDVRLGEDLVTDVAREVQGRGKRIVYLTGYSDADLIPEYVRDHPILAKPVQRAALLDAVGKR